MRCFFSSVVVVLARLESMLPTIMMFRDLYKRVDDDNNDINPEGWEIC